MAEPIVRKFVIDTAESEQNLKELNTQINATSSSVTQGAQSLNQVAAAEDNVAASSKSLKAQLRELQAQLAATDPNSEKYRELAAAAGQVKDQIKDAAEAVGTQAGGAFERVSGSLGLVTSRIASLDFTGAAEGAKLLAQNIGQVKFDDIANGLKGLADGFLSIGRSLIQNPIFLIGAALAAVVIYWEELDTAIKGLNPELQRTTALSKSLNDEINKQSESVGKQVSQINALFNAVQDQTKADEERKAALEAIQTLYPDVFANQNVDINNTDALTNAKLTLVKAIEAEAKANAAKVLIEQQYAKQFELQLKIQEQQLKVTNAQIDADKVRTFKKSEFESGQEFAAQGIAAQSALESAKSELNDLQQELANNAKNIADIEKVVGDTIVTQAINTAQAKKTENKKVVDDKKKLNDEEKRDEEKLAKELIDIRRKNAELSAAISKKILEDSKKKTDTPELTDYDAQLSAQRELQQLQIALMEEGTAKEIALVDLKYMKMRDAAQGNAEQLKIIAQLNANEVAAIEEEAARKRKAYEFAVQDAKLQAASDALGAINGLVSAFAKGDERRAKAAFKVQKALSIAQATVDTYKAANAIFYAAAANPATVLFPAQPFIAAGVAIASGLANVATIAQQQFQGGTSPGANNETAPNLPGDTGGGSQPAQFNPLAASFLDQRQEQITPRAYVLAGDVASAAEVRENVADLARIG